MKCQPEYLTSEFVFRCRISAREMVNASRHTSNLLSDPLQRFSKTRDRSEEVDLDPGANLACRRVIRSYFWAAFVPAIYPATAPPTPPTTMDVRTTPHGQTGHDANNAAKRLICVLLPQTS